MEKKRARVITGWRHIVPPKARSPKVKLAPAPGGKAAPKLPLAPVGKSRGEPLEAEVPELPVPAK